jgi:hypothetical protein
MSHEHQAAKGTTKKGHQEWPLDSERLQPIVAWLLAGTADRKPAARLRAIAATVARSCPVEPNRDHCGPSERGSIRAAPLPQPGAVIF